MGRVGSSLRQLSSGNITQSVAELIETDESQISPKEFERRSSRSIQVDYEVETPDENLEEYSRLYRSNPLIGQPINTVASEVIEPGWYIEAESDETVEELTEYMENVAIVENEVRQNFSKLVYLLAIEYYVRGTAIIEKTYNDDGNPNALNPLQVETFEFNKKPGTSILLAPDDTEFDHVKLTSDGKAAAYVQFDNDDPRWSERKEKRFARDEIIKLARNPDIGSATGTSAVQAVFDRALALESKMRDNDDAIAMKAWPMVLFLMGSEDSPWSRSEMDDFMEDFDANKFGPGMMKAVAGDVDIAEFAGETADIEHAVETDVNFIITGMPGAKYGLGGFVDDVSQTVAAAQERQFRKQVRHIRRLLEDKFTPYLEEVAEAYSLDADGLELVIGRPGGDLNPEDINGNLIRYTSDVSGNDDPSQMPRDGDGDGVVLEDQIPDAQKRNTNTRGPTMDSMLADGGDVMDESSGIFSSLADGPAPLSDDDEVEAEELADSRLVGTGGAEGELASLIENVLLSARDHAITNIKDRASRGQQLSSVAIDGAVQEATDRAFEEHGFTQSAIPHLEVASQSTISTLNQPNHAPQMAIDHGPRHRSIAENVRSSLVRDVRDTADDLGDTMRHLYEQTAYGNGSLEMWEDRVRESRVASAIGDRAQTISRMRAQHVINRVKLTEYERAEEVLGVRYINPCTQNTTRLCKHVAGCGARDGVVAHFGREQTIGEQVREQVDDEMLFDGFIPGFPPLHYGCRTELIPYLGDGDR